MPAGAIHKKVMKLAQKLLRTGKARTLRSAVRKAWREVKAKARESKKSYDRKRAQKVMKRRSKRAVTLDRKKKAKIPLDFETWAERPGRYDWPDIDTPLRPRVVDGILYWKHRTSTESDQAYITIVDEDADRIVKIPSRCDWFSRRNYRRVVKKEHDLPAKELLVIGKSGTIPGAYGWGGGWFRARIKPGKKTIKFYIKTRTTSASIIIRNVDLVEFKRAPWETDRWCGYKILHKSK